MKYMRHSRNDIPRQTLGTRSWLRFGNGKHIHPASIVPLDYRWAYRISIWGTIRSPEQVISKELIVDRRGKPSPYLCIFIWIAVRARFGSLHHGVNVTKITRTICKRSIARLLQKWSSLIVAYFSKYFVLKTTFASESQKLVYRKNMEYIFRNTYFLASGRSFLAFCIQFVYAGRLYLKGFCDFYFLYQGFTPEDREELLVCTRKSSTSFGSISRASLQLFELSLKSHGA